MRQVVLIAHDIRSAHNIGSLLRTADGLGLERVILTGYSPYPIMPSDERLPHIAQKVHKQIAKTALGAENSMAWEKSADIFKTLEDFKNQGYSIIALEQAKDSVDIADFKPPDKLVLVVGNEVYGVDKAVLKAVDQCLEIPMNGQKESFNVAVAAAMALFWIVSV